MSTLQLQLYDMIGQLSDNKAQLIIEVIKNFVQAPDIKQSSAVKQQRCIGLYKDEKFLADGYDIDECNDEIAALFEVE